MIFRCLLTKKVPRRGQVRAPGVVLVINSFRGLQLAHHRKSFVLRVRKWREEEEEEKKKRRDGERERRGKFGCETLTFRLLEFTFKVSSSRSIHVCNPITRYDAQLNNWQIPSKKPILYALFASSFFHPAASDNLSHLSGSSFNLARGNLAGGGQMNEQTNGWGTPRNLEGARRIPGLK